MTETKKNVLLTAVLLIGTIGFANCSSTSTTTTDNTNTAVVNTNPATPTPEVIRVEAGEKIGIPECDEYIEKYQACINNKVPEWQRKAFKTSFEAIREGWRASAANPQTRPALGPSCKLAIETAKKSTGAYSCDW